MGRLPQRAHARHRGGREPLAPRGRTYARQAGGRPCRMDKVLFPGIRQVRLRAFPHTRHPPHRIQPRMVRGAVVEPRAGQVHRGHVLHHVPCAYRTKAVRRAGLGHHRLGKAPSRASLLLKSRTSCPSILIEPPFTS